VRKDEDKGENDLSNQTIFAVDDEAHILELIRFNLEHAGFRVVTAATGEEALRLFHQAMPALLLLDIMLPGMDGLEVCKRLKAEPKTSAVPIIMLTARSEEIDKILGLELGADDYMTKPFSVRELVARVKALLRRASIPQGEGKDTLILQVGDLTMDTANYEVYKNGLKIELTLKEYEVLKLLVLNRGKVLSRDTLLDKVWGYEYFGETRTVDVHIRHLRQKLGDTDGAYIETIRGVGYKFPKEVRG
jgi:two-component system alkaline phosphatase synthesis response regulator PhoP